MSEPENVLSVTALTREIRELLESRIGTVWVEGEISNHRLQNSGHHYFTLKDSGAQISCVLFRGVAQRSPARLADGVQMQVQGELSVYEPRGQYQLVVRAVQLKGQGSLQARFEALKRRLYDEGLFDEERKRPIPRFPQTLALVTSPTGAAIQDMLNILRRRAPWLHLMIYPVRVQGVGVEKESIRALEVLNAAETHGLPRPDAIIIGRGGGSLEDLWAYNEEALARAIATSEIPIVSAVGHEIDFTIADFVADLRAPTPSAAAELITPDGTELRRQLEAAELRLKQWITHELDQRSRLLDLVNKGALHHEPLRYLQRQEQLLDEREHRLQQLSTQHLQELKEALASQQHTLTLHHPKLRLSSVDQRLQSQAQRLQQAAMQQLDRAQQRLQARQDLIHHLGPHAVLTRGFSYTLRENGSPLRRATELEPGDKIITMLAEGKVTSVVA
jgi:exodeoxyribonuclease VII large subunit